MNNDKLASDKANYRFVNWRDLAFKPDDTAQ